MLTIEPYTKQTMVIMILYVAKALLKGGLIFGVKKPSVLSEYIDIFIHVVHC